MDEGSKKQKLRSYNDSDLRSMSLAKYDPKLSSHFALSIEKYTHFTSPIRRYAD